MPQIVRLKRASLGAFDDAPGHLHGDAGVSVGHAREPKEEPCEFPICAGAATALRPPSPEYGG